MSVSGGPTESTVLIPGFADPDNDRPDRAVERLYEGLELEALCKRLSRADCERNEDFRALWEQRLLTYLGFSIDDDFPVAALFGATGPDTCWYMKADPVSLRAGLNEVTVTGPAELALSEAETEEIVDSINDHFGTGDWYLQAHDTENWIICSSRCFEVRTTPLSKSANTTPGTYLPSGKDGPYWRRVLTEIQMLLHDCAVNERRRKHRPPVNSLWLWGGGERPARPVCRWAQVWGDDRLLGAAARFLGLHCKPTPQNPARVMESLDERGPALIVLDDLLEPIRTRDLGLWRKRLEELSREWIVPLIDGHRAQLRPVTFDLGLPTRFVCARKSQRRWWRRTRSLKMLLHAGA